MAPAGFVPAEQGADHAGQFTQHVRAGLTQQGDGAAPADMVAEVFDLFGGDHLLVRRARAKHFAHLAVHRPLEVRDAVRLFAARDRRHAFTGCHHAAQT